MTMTTRGLMTFLVVFVACRSPTGTPPASTPTPQAAPSRPLSTRRIFWSRSDKLVAAAEHFSCGPPSRVSGVESCTESSWIRVMSTDSPREHRHAEGEIFGFRADGEWLVVRAKDRGIEEWSSLTDAKRPSAFAPLLKDATAACLSPDDDHMVVVDQGHAVVRARTTADETSIVSPSTSALDAPASDCAFSPDGKTFALATERAIALYRLGSETPDTWIPFARASDLTWSPDGHSLTFAVLETETLEGPEAALTFRWHPKQNRVEARSGHAAFHPRLPEVIVRGSCEWNRFGASDGKWLGRLGPTTECFHVREHAVSLSSTGRFIAALEGSWGSKELVLQPL